MTGVQTCALPIYLDKRTLSRPELVGKFDNLLGLGEILVSNPEIVVSNPDLALLIEDDEIAIDDDVLVDEVDSAELDLGAIDDLLVDERMVPAEGELLLGDLDAELLLRGEGPGAAVVGAGPLAPGAGERPVESLEGIRGRLRRQRLRRGCVRRRRLRRRVRRRWLRDEPVRGGPVPERSTRLRSRVGVPLRVPANKTM